ncbi:hypothetical protein bcgnr5378_61930 [Bacillus cereus]|uniref:Positive regulator of CheA protein activity (CheW) n=1 Tax=Bacillus cereus TaxID=1396 RepID=A0A164QR74_BACCE|nr:chemotaxis protein CheW [Bacillus cereus]KZD72063.1 Positive regulator of CheA protein activity (CheW) [Bacillus cereus]HDR8321086.1 chemotaxis protein CheW [Bacillus cereus]HDR8327257.1 chemotaxis protein CheW [Bacillus cereus]HDR8333027.1 chemotaxis protein CheW [Bacillus cereus]
MNLTHEIPEEHVIFTIGRETFALNAAFVKRIEINKHNEKRTIPNTSKEFPGIIIVEDDIVQLYDLRVKFDMHTTELEQLPYVIISKFDNSFVVGFVVDHVEDVIKIPHDAELGKVNDQLAGTTLDYIKGIYRPNKNIEQDNGNEGEQIYSILNVEKLFTQKDIQTITNNVQE